MSIGPVLRRLWNHPLNRPHRLRAIGRFTWWQLRSRLARGRKLTVRFVDDTRLSVGRQMYGATGCIYSGFEEPQEMGFALHFLRPDDLFVDVGANVGVYCVLAAGAVGAEVIAFEPVQSTLVHLYDNLRLNDLTDRCAVHPLAVGDREGVVTFTTQDDVMNRVAFDAKATTVDVPQTSLDAFLGSRVPTLLKIDVEGFETKVIDGAERLLREPALAGVLIELVGEARHYGFDEDALHRRLIALGLHPCQYDPVTRKFREGVAGDGWNKGRASIYVRDIASAQARVSAAPRHRIASGMI